jgi:hypothetical protein
LASAWALPSGTLQDFLGGNVVYYTISVDKGWVFKNKIKYPNLFEVYVVYCTISSKKGGVL